MRFLPLACTALAAAALAQQPASPTVHPWTFCIYAAIDNSAEADGNFFAFLEGVRRAYADDPGLEIVLFVDRSDKYSTNATAFGEDFTDARLYRVGSTSCERLDGGAEFPEITRTSSYEADSADPVTLRKFLAWARAQHPAQHQALMLYGHADGRGMCPDQQSGHEMGFAQLTDVVPAELSVDLMALELCNMGGIEIAYQWRPGNGGFATSWLVAIPNAGPPLDWGRVFARVRTGGGADTIAPAALAPQAFGELIVEEGGNGRRAAAAADPAHARALGYEAVACYDLAQAVAVKRAVDALAVQLAAGDTLAAVAAARGPGDDGCALDYARDQLQRMPFVDLYDLAQRIGARRELPDAARKAASAVAAATDAFVTASYGGAALPRFQPGRCGVYITFPTRAGAATDGSPGQATWERCRWYSPKAVPGVYGQLAWCRDGAVAGDGIVQNWFELLDRWFDAGPDGGANGVAY